MKAPVLTVSNKKKKKPSESESSIQNKILSYLGKTNLLFWRQNAGALFIGGRMVRLGAKGLPDIVIVIPPNGKILGLEVKSKTGRLRPAQEEFRDRLLRSGGRYAVVRSLNEVRLAIHSAKLTQCI